MPQDEIPADLPADDGKPRLHAEVAVAQAFGSIGLNWAHFQDDHPDEAAVLLDAATMAEAYHDDGLEEAARAVVEAWDADQRDGSVTDPGPFDDLGDAIDQLRVAIDDSPAEQDPSDDELAAMPDAEPVGGENGTAPPEDPISAEEVRQAEIDKTSRLPHVIEGYIVSNNGNRFHTIAAAERDGGVKTRLRSAK